MQRIAAVVPTTSSSDLGVSDKVDRIGLGAPGPMDLPRGYLVAPPQLPTWWDFPIRDTVSQLSESAGFILERCQCGGLWRVLAGQWTRRGFDDSA